MLFALDTTAHLELYSLGEKGSNSRVQRGKSDVQFQPQSPEKNKSMGETGRRTKVLCMKG